MPDRTASIGICQSNKAELRARKPTNVRFQPIEYHTCDPSPKVTALSFLLWMALLHEVQMLWHRDIMRVVIEAKMRDKAPDLCSVFDDLTSLFLSLCEALCAFKSAMNVRFHISKRQTPSMRAAVPVQTPL
jgi:hypothetical protein